MFHDTQPAQLGADGQADAWSEFRVDHPGQIAALLCQLRDRATPVQLCGPSGDSMTTSVWAVDESRRRISLDVDTARPQLAPLVDADEVVAVTYLDAVKLQFDLHDLYLVRGAAGSALQAALPRAMYRFQRRGAYRVRVSAHGAPSARMRHPALPDMTLSLRVIDVSAGGCCLALPDDVPPLEPGTRVAAVTVELDESTRFQAGLRLEHVSAIGGGVRIGCAWEGLDAVAARALQRCIDQAQRHDRLRVAG